MIGKRGRIVFADDEEASRTALGAILLENGYAVALAANDDDALRLVAEERPDVLLVGPSVARMDRHGLLARMKSGFPEVVVVVFAEPNEVQRAVQLLREGAHAYLVKPFEMDELDGLLGRVLGTRRATKRTMVPRADGGVTVPGSSLEDIEREAILKTLEACGGSTGKAAGVLRISSRTIQYKLKQYRAETVIASRTLGGTQRRG